MNNSIKTLVLNKSWVPVRVISGIDAICKVANRKAKCLTQDYSLCEFETWINNWSDLTSISVDKKERLIRTPRFNIVVPEIIVLNSYNGYVKLTVRLTRKNIYERDDYTCQYCGRKMKTQLLNFDHILPSSRGGKTTWENIVTSCIKCNNKKSNKTLEESGLKLIRKPHKPSWVFPQTNFKLPKCWAEFVGKLYWNIELKN